MVHVRNITILLYLITSGVLFCTAYIYLLKLLPSAFHHMQLDKIILNPISWTIRNFYYPIVNPNRYYPKSLKTMSLFPSINWRRR